MNQKINRLKSSVLLILLSATLTLSAQTVSTQYGVEMPGQYTCEIDAVYKEVGKWKGRMDIYYNEKAEVPTPLVINIHGGAWTHGQKETQTGFKSFFRKGFAVANVEYRLAADAYAPAAIEDVRCALLYMIEHAGEYNIDTDRIVVMGGSAGGHLALMAGLVGYNQLFDKECSKAKPVKVAAIIDKYGITDLTAIPAGKWRNKSALLWLDSNKDNMGFLESISPVTYVNPENPPVFIVHGDADPVVPYEQSVLLHEKLDKAGVINSFITIEGGLHGKFNQEDKSRVSHAIINFLVEQKIVD
jgi:acetyl esterase/lipase